LVEETPTRAVEHWDAIAATRWGRYITAAESALIEQAQTEAPAPRYALDIGCGGGRWTRFLLDRGWAVTSLDVDPDAVATTAARNPTAHCLLVGVADRELPVADHSVSLILCIEVLPVAHSDWFFREAHRVLVPGGVLVTVAWNSSSVRGKVTDAASRIRSRAPTTRPRTAPGDATSWPRDSAWWPNTACAGPRSGVAATPA
jgi:SAM-dependent methyltransferase